MYNPVDFAARTQAAEAEDSGTLMPRPSSIDQSGWKMKATSPHVASVVSLPDRAGYFRTCLIPSHDCYKDPQNTD